MAENNEVLNAREAAASLGVSLRTIYMMRSSGKGPVSYRRGREIQFFRSDILAYLAREREATRRGGNL
ncbi:helix-turn-helix domain-containing protein [Mycobacteroides abscessus]|uniref:helix-turn-helix domain-containing protein n=1 Tax=Mycobacteroides abscessus TaxID=36809 RepID=UPI0012FFD8EB|nr:helix-turn-helix domain-containing protein [Mycobacteroides abscessus]